MQIDFCGSYVLYIMLTAILKSGCRHTYYYIISIDPTFTYGSVQYVWHFSIPGDPILREKYMTTLNLDPFLQEHCILSYHHPSVSKICFEDSLRPTTVVVETAVCGVISFLFRLSNGGCNSVKSMISCDWPRTRRKRV